MKYSFYSFLLLIWLCSCTASPKPGRASVIPRDTTIHPQNAFTGLTLDSTIVASFTNKAKADDSLKNKLRSFYNDRNYQYAWFTEDGLSEAGQAFWNLHQNGDTCNNSSENRSLHTAMKGLLNDDELQLSNNSIQQIELNLTLHFFRYIRAAFEGSVNPEEMQWHIPKRKVNATALLDSFLSNNDKTFRPLNASFYQLQSKLKQYSEVEKGGGWNVIEPKSKALKEGQSSDAVTSIKKRLKASGDFMESDTSLLFTQSLTEAVKKAERRFGLKEDGIVGKNLIEKLNVPAEERMQQMLINLERMRWLPSPQPNRLVANIAEYRLHVYEGGKEVLGMNIVVGKAANRTVVFSDELQYVVFSPYWNVPRSIVRAEIVPAMNRSNNYLRRNNMEITGQSNGLPVVRQKPGGSNALGRVKFIFPNQYNIYFHDTPAKTLFSKEARAFSHGCVRVQEPFTLAKYLLRNDVSWTDAKIKMAMNSRKENWVKLPKTVPVYLIYLTAWVDSDGLLHFRDDIYGHDKRMAERLFIDENNDKH